jgi:hypothetical protein
MAAGGNLCAGGLSRRDDSFGHIGNKDGVAVYQRDRNQRVCITFGTSVEFERRGRGAMR